MAKSLIPGPHKGYTPDTRQRLQRATRFFARAESFDLECPRCGKVYQVRMQAEITQNWDPRTARFTCTSRLCGRTYIIGIVAWPVTQHDPGTPEDQVPSPRQLAMLRKEAGGWWLAEEARITADRPTTTNLTLEEDRPAATAEAERERDD